MEKQLKNIKKLLVANRGEIAIRVMRAGSELKIRTVAIYTYEDRYSLHRYKADEAYQIGSDEEPLKPYLDIEEIIKLAKKVGADAIHPGYGFLSENVTFVRRCQEEGIIFVGPEPEVMDRLGDKVSAKKIARACNVPLIEDNQKELNDKLKKIVEVTGIPEEMYASKPLVGVKEKVFETMDQFSEVECDYLIAYVPDIVWGDTLDILSEKL